MDDIFTFDTPQGAEDARHAYDNAENALSPDLLTAIRRYERALMANDTATLDDLFASDPDGIPVVRSDGRGMLVGHTAITAFRKRRKNVPTRTLRRRIARQLDESNACIVSQFDKVTGGSVVQTQVWRRVGTDHTWKIVMAHLTYPSPAVDRSIWRIVGTPLVAAAKPGPLSGMNIAVKDLYAVQGQRIGAGNPEFLRTSPICESSAPAVRLLLNAGADVKGIAQTDEFAYSLAGTNVHYGTPPNPKAPGCVSGGSSSGPASAVACGQADIGLGTDTAGSIRIPASYQGLWGIRTTHGLISLDSTHPLSQSFDTVGWMTRDAQTLEFVGKVMMPDKDATQSVSKLLTCPKLDGCVTSEVRIAFCGELRTDRHAGRYRPSAVRRTDARQFPVDFPNSARFRSVAQQRRLGRQALRRPRAGNRGTFRIRFAYPPSTIRAGARTFTANLLHSAQSAREQRPAHSIRIFDGTCDYP